jgi:hypothetical protein
MRVPRYEVSPELDDQTIELHINQARRTAELALIPINRERFGWIYTIDVTPTLVPDLNITVPFGAFGGTVQWYQALLPPSFVQIESVHVRHGEYPTDRWEAREVSSREVYSMGRQSVNRPTPEHPVFFIDKSPQNNQYQITVSKGAAPVRANDIVIYFIGMVGYMQQFPNDDVEVKIGYDAEELVILMAIKEGLGKIYYPTLGPLVEQDVQNAIQFIEGLYNFNVDSRKLLLPTRERLAPNTPNTDIPPNQQRF